MHQENNLYSLAYNCPVQDREIDCPFKELDLLSFKEKVKWVEGLSKEEKKAILKYHKNCSCNRQ